MVLVNKSGCWQLGWVSVLVISEATLSASRNYLLAQIVPDRTLGDESSALAPNAEVKGLPAELIEGGAARGSNLFHSFAEFNVGELQRVYFANPTGIENILSRVTGSNVSNILGTLGVDGIANLFFLNPNGIIFGENAQLDVAGSFVGSTANSFVFPDGSEFSATNPTAPPLLKINLTPGLQYGQNPREDIVNSGNLTVAPRQILSLSGKDVTNTGNLTASGGTVQLLGERVGVLDNAKIDVSSETRGGTVLIGGEYQGRDTLINASRTYIDNSVTINADALIKGNGGRVIVWADEVTGFYGNISARGGSVSGNGGFVEVSGKEHLIFRGNVDTSAVNGFTGTLLLDPTNIIIANGSGDEAGDGTDTFAGNNSGEVGSILSTPLSEIDDTAPTTIFESELEGLSGDTNVILQAKNNITIEDLADDELTFAPGSGVIALTADADSDGVGDFVMEDNTVVFDNELFEVVDDADTITTNGRSIAISGANLTLGNIDTSSVPIDNAGETIKTAQIVSPGSGILLQSIFGSLSETDDVDTYQIFLTGDRTFSVSTVDDAEFDTQLFLFDAAGFGVYANDDHADCNCYQSTLPAENPLTPTLPGIYYLAISAFGVEPVSEGGRIFSNNDFQAIKAPTGEGGTLPLSGFESESSSDGILDGIKESEYTINLTGVEGKASDFVEETFYEFEQSPAVNGGSINLNATQGNISVNSLISTNEFGDGGAIILTAEGHITAEYLDSSSFSQTSSFSIVGNNYSGNGGAIILTAGDNIITGALNSSSDFKRAITDAGNGGKITLTAGGNITAEYLDSSSVSRFFNAGNGGAITLTAGGHITNITTTVDTHSSILTVDTHSGSGSHARNGGAITFTAGGNITTGDLWSYSGSGGNAENGGDIALTAGGNIITGELLSRSSFGGNAKNGGAITLTADGDITTQDLNSFSSGDNNAGNGGAITFTAGRNVTTQDLNSFSFSRNGDAGNGGEIILTAKDGDFVGILSPSLAGDIVEISSPTFASFSVSENGTAGNGGNIILKAKGKVKDIEILTMSSDSNSGAFKLTGFGDLSVINTNIITSKQLEIDTDQDGTVDLALDVGEEGQSGDVTVTSNGNLTFNNSRIENDTKGSDPAGNVNITSPDLITFNNSKIVSDSSSTGAAGNISVSADRGITFADSNSGIFAQASDEGKAGSITVNTPELTLQQDAEISTSTTGVGKAGDITLNTDILNLASGGKVLASTSGSGDGGTITVNAPKEVNLGIGVQDFEPIISVETSGAGKAGDIFVTTPTLTLSDTARITATATNTATNTEGGGSISLNASKMDLAGIVGVFAETQGESPAGTLTLQPDNNKPTLDLTLAPGAKISASTSASGNGGDLLVSAPQAINISGQGKLAVETTGMGDAGNIELNTQKLTLSDGVEISASTSGGAGGTIKVTANTFDATDGAKLLTTTSGESNAGSIILNVSDNITLAGDNTELFANTTSKSTGDGGSIFIDPETIIIQDGASIAVNSQGSGEGGNIELQAGSLTLEQGMITAETASNQGGNINLQLLDLLTLRNSSQISANAGTAKTPEAEGDGGNINIDSPFILSFPDNNNITAKAFLGTGGNINITTNSIFGSEFLDISVSSEFGLEGTVSIDTLELEPSQGLVELPSKPETPQILQGCEVSGGGGSSFINTGRGGLPPSPTETLSSREVWKDVQLPTQLTKNSANAVNHSNTTPERIVEATGWIINEEGILELVAEKSSDTHQGSCR